MGLPEREESAHTMSIVVEHQNELYSLIVDDVGEVLKVSEKNFVRFESLVVPFVNATGATDSLIGIFDIRTHTGDGSI